MTMAGILKPPLPLSPKRDRGEESVDLGPLPEDPAGGEDLRDLPGFFPRFDFFFAIETLHGGHAPTLSSHPVPKSFRAYLRSWGIPKG